MKIRFALRFREILLLAGLLIINNHASYNQTNTKKMTVPSFSTETATFGGGCFWCTEAVFERLKGVQNVVSGYSGGSIKNPAYREVTSGRTGHAEVVQIHFDPAQISYKELLEVFFSTHDPTSLNRQGADVGTQYRSVIFFQNPEQQKAAIEYIDMLNNNGKFRSKIVTAVEAFQNFYPAEDYHQDYFRNNPDVPYCSYVIQPKMKKLNEGFAGMLK